MCVQISVDGIFRRKMELDRETWLCTIRVLDVLPDIVEILELYLENPQKGGGNFLNSHYDPDKNHFTVVFQDSIGKFQIQRYD